MILSVLRWVLLLVWMTSTMIYEHELKARIVTLEDHTKRLAIENEFREYEIDVLSMKGSK